MILAFQEMFLIMRPLKYLFVLSATLLASACGTIIDGQTQKVTLLTPGASEAECTFDNGVRYMVTSGETIEIMRSRSDLVVDCYAVGNRHKQIIVESGYNDWSAANVTNAVVPGVGYDHLSGGLYEYPPVISVDFIGMPTPGFGLPEYHNIDAENPYKQKIEDYGPTTPRIENDSAYLKRGVTKREGGTVNSNPFSTYGTSGTAQQPAGMTPMPGSGGNPAPTAPAPVLKGGSADALTRSMNPTVFNNQ